MNILITGNTGYIGPVLIRHLRQNLPHHRYAGFDNGYFAHVLTGASRLPETQFDAQYWGDLREFPNDLLDSVDVLAHDVLDDLVGADADALGGNSGLDRVRATCLQPFLDLPLSGGQ